MGYKVLLADDSITIQKVIGIIFANEDYDLTVVDNGNAALVKAKEIQPDVMLVDALMPGMSGYDLCREVRQDTSLQHIPLLLLVGAFEPFDEEKARNSGADDHISKPFESQLLIEKVRKLIELGGERAEAHAQAAMETSVVTEAPIVNLGAETEAVSSVSAAVAESGTAGEKPADTLYFNSLEIVEASPGDDLWGVFEIEEVAEDEDIQLGEIIEEEELPPGAIDSVEEIEPFVFREDDQVAPEIETSISLGEYPETGADEGFVLNEKPRLEEDEESVSAMEQFPEAAETAAFSEPDEGEEALQQMPDLSEMPASVLDAIESAPVHEPPFQGIGEEFEPATQENLVPDNQFPGFQSENTSESVAAEAGSGTVSLSEDQLAALLSKVSRDIIEKIAWEVVPDLAESIIREEIRKIKEGY